MFDFLVQFNAIDNITRSIDRINDRLDDLRRRADTASRNLRDRFRNLNLRARVELNLERAEAQLRKLQNKLKNIGDGGKGLAQWGMGTLMAGAGMMGTALLPLNTAREYELAFKDVKKAVDGTDAELEKVYEAMKKFEGVSFADVAVAYAEAGKMGFDAKTVSGFADGVIKGATALDFSVEEAIGQMGKILAMTNQMDTAVESSQDIMDKIAALENNLSGVKASGVIDIWKRNADIYNSLKFDNATMGAMSGFLEQSYVSSELGASGFKMMINKFKELEPELGYLEKIETKGLEGLKEVMADINKMTPTQQIKKFGSGPMELIQKLQSQENLAKLDMALEVSMNATGSVDKEWDVFIGTFDQKIQGAKKQFDNFMDSLGRIMLPIASQLVDAITPLIDKISNWVANNEELARNIMIVALVAGAFVAILAVIAIIVGTVGMALGALAPIIGFVASVIGGLLTTLRVLRLAWILLNIVMMANPMILIVLGVLALIAVIVVLVMYFDVWWNWLVNIFNEFMKIEWVQNAISTLGGIVSAVFNAMMTPFRLFISLWTVLINWVQMAWDKIGGFSGALDIARGAIGAIGGAFLALISPISTAISWLDKFLSKFEIYNSVKGAVASGWNKLTGGGDSSTSSATKVRGRVDVNVSTSGGARASTSSTGVNLRTSRNGIR